MNARQTNVGYRKLFDQLESRWQTGNQVLFAAMNEILNQVFPVLENNSLYQQNYSSPKF